MNRHTLLCLVSALVAAPALAQLRLPPPSPSASVKQQVGLTDITVEYSSPGVKKRKIWGDLVPYEKPWRAGANSATKVTFSRDVTFGGKPVPAGSYALVAHPTAKGWQLSLNKESDLWGTDGYKPENDVVKVPVTTAAAPMRERLVYLFNNTTDSETSLDLEWEKLRVSVPIKVDTAAHAQANIKKALDNAWSVYASAARYAGDNKDFTNAMKLVDQSLAIESNWYNNWVKAELLQKQGKIPEARTFAQAAMTMGEKEKDFVFKDEVAKALAEWKEKK